VGIVTRALLDEATARWAPTVAIGFQRRLAARFSVAADQVSWTTSD
jgi:hypothetical protein